MVMFRTKVPYNAQNKVDHSLQPYWAIKRLGSLAQVIPSVQNVLSANLMYLNQLLPPTKISTKVSVKPIMMAYFSSNLLPPVPGNILLISFVACLYSV